MVYGTVADWATYATARGWEAPSGSLADAALQRASDYIRTNYVVRFADQYDGTEPEVEEATYIAAQQELAAPFFWSKTFTPSQTKVLTQVEGIKWTPLESYSQGHAGDHLPVSPAIEALLVPMTRWGMPAVFSV